MLTRLITHLWHIVIFKIIILIASTIILFKIFYILKNDLVNIKYTLDETHKLGAEAIINLKSTDEFTKNINILNNKYQYLTTKPYLEEYQESNKLIKNIVSLSEKHHLVKPITIEINRNLAKSKLSIILGKIKLYYYDLIIRFIVKEPSELLQLYQEIYNILPNESLVIRTKIDMTETLTPEIIDTLSTSVMPSLFSVEIKVQLREIVYEK